MLADISGGDAKNAITKKAVAVVALKESLLKELDNKIKEIESVFIYEYKSLEKDLKINASECKTSYEKVMAKDTLDKIVTVMMTVPNGVLDMHTSIENLVETSSNLGVVNFNGASVSLVCFVRSSIESKKLFVVEQIKLIAEKAGAGFVADTDSPEWNPDPASKLVKLFQKTYKNIFNKELVCASVHAGLECGYFFKHFFNPKTQKSIDAVAIGPTIDDVHVPEETLYLDTVKPVVSLLLNVLANIQDYDKA
jgi:dipeptidase D